MMITRTLSLLIPFVLVMLLFSSISETCEGSSTSTYSTNIVLPPDPRPSRRKGTSSVKITNSLGPSIDLSLHCKSKDDDLGAQVLPYNASFGFDFNRNIWGTTLFFCGFRWGGEFHWFDVYTSISDCLKPCLWSVVATGPCLLISTIPHIALISAIHGIEKRIIVPRWFLLLPTK
ncbi:Self-incompatibility protein [Trema orientale]|uniref:S-protein homolog n=1 Tax=Trema orientale TaxID=63057 RepID=A0A2P5DHV7_TREOI|nr:Self-incompatibility protein [Trema orientale]